MRSPAPQRSHDRGTTGRPQPGAAKPITDLRTGEQWPKGQGPKPAAGRRPKRVLGPRPWLFVVEQCPLSILRALGSLPVWAAIQPQPSAAARWRHPRHGNAERRQNGLRIVYHLFLAASLAVFLMWQGGSRGNTPPRGDEGKINFSSCVGGCCREPAYGASKTSSGKSPSNERTTNELEQRRSKRPSEDEVRLFSLGRLGGQNRLRGFLRWGICGAFKNGCLGLKA